MSETTTAADRDVSSEQNFVPPRDPGAFAPTEHYLERAKPEVGMWSRTRANPAITADIVETAIEEGTFEHAGGDDPDRYAYEHVVNGRRWRVIVIIDEDRAGEPGATHDLLTAYAEVHR